MPVYMDSHDGTELPAELRRFVEARVQSGDKDEHGVVDRGIVIDKVDGKLHCVLEAPDQEAVMKHHESLDSPIDPRTIHEADIIMR